jgi:hypothetical protein
MVRDVTAEVASACDPFLNAIENAAEAQTLARGRFPTALESGEAAGAVAYQGAGGARILSSECPG